MGEKRKRGWLIPFIIGFIAGAVFALALFLLYFTLAQPVALYGPPPAMAPSAASPMTPPADTGTSSPNALTGSSSSAAAPYAISKDTGMTAPHAMTTPPSQAGASSNAAHSAHSR